MPTTPGSNMSGAAPAGPAPAMQEEKQQEIESREAYEYWGYLFKPDKTGTDKLKGLLRGLKDVMTTQYAPPGETDVTPDQLARFYRELHGNYDQLFLGTPSESIAFIYKSLGCLHSLQPLQPHAAFTEPSVPSLKTDGWVMWQTIQLLLAPDEHSTFLAEAVQRWDVTDPATGELLPKILPRTCFPKDPDKHMVAWYEGVSERLRREADEELLARERLEADQAEVRRLNDHRGGIVQRRADDGPATDDEGSVDSRGPALAYFRNPLYRHVDGRPTIVRQNSKRPALSPRPTGMMGKGKEAASTMGHVIKNIGSPHLWDGRGKSESSERHQDRERRRRSLPENRHHLPGDPPPSAGYDAKMSPGSHLSGHDRHRRRRSSQMERPSSADEEWEELDNDSSAVYSPRPSPHHHHRRRRGESEDYDASLRHSRSHEPTPSQKEYPDYFHGYDDPARRRNSSAYDTAAGGTPISANGMGPSFGPSASPLFASHVAKQPGQQQPARLPLAAEPYGPLSRNSPSVRRHAHERPYSHSPDPALYRDERDRDRRRYDSRERRPRYEESPAPLLHDDRVGSPPSSVGGPPGFPPPGAAGGGSGGGYAPLAPIPSRERRSARMSGSDAGGAAYVSAPEDRDGRRSRQKQARFAQGVDGRRYADQSPWR